jgi:hypothetical protein
MGRSRDGIGDALRGARRIRTVKESARVEKVIREAVKHFVRTGELAAGEYGLAPPWQSDPVPIEGGTRHASPARYALRTHRFSVRLTA